MKTLLIIYHSTTGGSKAMAHAVAEGAATEAEIRTLLLHASEANAEHVLQADGYVFIAPETLGSMAGLMKDFFDRTYYAALDQINGRPYTALVCAGSDGQGAVKQIQRIATGWRLSEMAAPEIVCTHAQTPEDILAPKTINPEDLQRCRDLGAAFASGLVMGLF
ncbi:MAG: NAD(P)H-dependent oxidoreductase [Limnobacter sp.]|uniref:flavodoxin family protein n=1 Tax=Limnobacter sp. TaxID=2003368 RepID=UPI0032EB606D